jgi:type IV pilus assembly protein PilW
MKREEYVRLLVGFRGFTLLELLIGLVVSLVAIGAVYSVYIVQQHCYVSQQRMLELQQNLRAAVLILEKQVRLAGYDPENTGRFGITDVRRYDLVETRTNPNGQPALFYTADKDENGVPDDRNNFRNREHLSFRIRFDENTQRYYLAFDMGGGRQPLAENIQAIGFAYAVDVNHDGQADPWKNTHCTIWAVDSDNDNLLDTNIDTNLDGRIDERDDSNGDGRITAADGGGLNPAIAPDAIKAVKMWLYAVSNQPVKNHFDRNTYVIGDRIIDTSGDNFKRQLVERVIECRNL